MMDAQALLRSRGIHPLVIERTQPQPGDRILSLGRVTIVPPAASEAPPPASAFPQARAFEASTAPTFRVPR